MFANIFNTPEKLLKQLMLKEFNEAELNSYLKSKVDLNHQNDKKETLLHICIKMSKNKSAIWLINNNCNLTLCDKNGNTPIESTIIHNNEVICHAILKTKKIDIKQRNHQGRTLLHEAVISGNRELVKILIQNGVDINQLDNNKRNALFDAISYGDDKIVDNLLDVDTLDINNVDIDGNTVLHKIETQNNDELAKKLLNSGANPNITNKEGQNFLFFTALRGQEGEELLDLAVDKGCDLDGRVRNNNSIFMEIMFAFSALSQDEKERRSSLLNMSKNLVGKGIDVNIINDLGETVIFDAIRKNDLEAVQFLLNDKVALGQKNKKGETALSISITRGFSHQDITLLLLSNNADPTQKIANSRTVIELLNDIILYIHNGYSLTDKNILSQIDMKGGKYLAIMRDVLESSPIDVNFNDAKGDPIFFKPLLYDNIELFRLYVSHGIDINKKNSNNLTLIQEYILKKFNNNEESTSLKSALTVLVNNKADVNIPMPITGRTVLAQVLSKKNCNPNLVKSMVERTRVKYEHQDLQGRTLIHSCISGQNIKLIFFFHTLDQNLINIPDYHGMLPITYVALSGDTKLTLALVKMNSFITTSTKLSKQAKIKFAPLLKNLKTLDRDLLNKDDIRKISIVRDQINQEFHV